MENKVRPLLSSAFRAYSKDVKGHVLVSFSFLVVASLGLAFGMFSPFLLLVSVPLLFVPAFFAAQMSTQSLKSGGTPLSFRQQSAYFLGYFNSPFIGCYRVGMALLKALPAIAIGIAATSIFWYLASPSFDPAYREAIEAFTAHYASGDIEGAANLLAESPSVMLEVSVSSGVAGLLAWLLSAHHLSNYVCNAYVRPFFGQVPSRLANSIYCGAFETFKRRYYQRTRPMRLIGLSLLGIGFALGLALGLAFSFPFPMTMVFAHFLSTLFITPYLPLYFQAQDIESKRNRYYISYHLLETARRDFDSLFIDPTIPEETKKQAQESLKALENKVEEEKRFLDYEGE